MPPVPLTRAQMCVLNFFPIYCIDESAGEEGGEKKNGEWVQCTISEKVVFEKWNITTNGEANQNNFINEWRGEAESWVYEICFDLPSHELWYFISQKPLFQKFHFNFLYKELDSWNVFISCTSPWYIISQNHISKSFLKIISQNLC